MAPPGWVASQVGRWWWVEEVATQGFSTQHKPGSVTTPLLGPTPTPVRATQVKTNENCAA